MLHKIKKCIAVLFVLLVCVCAYADDFEDFKTVFETSGTSVFPTFTSSFVFTSDIGIAPDG
ncbi:MAG: hypothetical protein LBT79_06450, partial [Elusimicrobiota bacterium]|nr:hypothetical protein [Elusimicrobiota bacterium]